MTPAQVYAAMLRIQSKLEAIVDALTEKGVKAMSLTILDGPLIPAGQSVSEPLDVSAGAMVRITTPLGWDGANITFLISTDGTEYNDLYLGNGEEVSIVCYGLNRAIIVPPGLTSAYNFIKFRSGTSRFPTIQSQDRQFAVTLDLPDAPAP